MTPELGVHSTLTLVHSEKLVQNCLRRLNIRVPFVNARLYIHLQLYMLRLIQRTYNTYHPTLNI
jgi:hypothetical protein